MEIENAKHHNGFTLIEMVVATGVFVIVITTLMNLYLIYARAQREAGLRQRIASESNFFMEKLAQEIRLNEIVYFGDITYNISPENLYSKDAENGISATEVELALIDRNNNRITYFFDNTEVGISVKSSCSIGRGIYKFTGTTVNPSTSCQKMFAIPNMEIIDVKFMIYPTANPYPDSNADCKSGTFNGYYCTCLSAGSECYSNSCDANADLCNHVDKQPRVTFNIVAKEKSDNTQIYLQTTVSARIYKR